MVPKWQFFASCISASRVHGAADFRRAFSDIQSPTAEIRRGKKERKKIESTGQKYNGLPYYIGRP